MCMKLIRKLFYRKERMDALVRFNNGEYERNDPYKLYYNCYTGEFVLGGTRQSDGAKVHYNKVTRNKPNYNNVTRNKPTYNKVTRRKS